VSQPSWTVEPLASRHDRAPFDCGEPSLTVWLKEKANQWAKRDLARTYVLVRPGEARVYGYYALSAAQVPVGDFPPAEGKGVPSALPVPAALLGRLAVDVTCRGQGLGSALLLDVFRKVRRLADEVGCRALIVDAIDDRAAAFYRARGFLEFLDDPRHLFLPVSVIRKLPLDGPSA
jgi:GNAT superfamily N-acetyltransferase